MTHKISFKKNKRQTGRAGVGYPYSSTDIKVDGKRVGYIYPPNRQSTDNMWYVYIAIVKKDIMEDGNKNCKWMWKMLRPKFWNETDARDYLKTYKQDIFDMPLHYFEN